MSDVTTQTKGTAGLSTSLESSIVDGRTDKQFKTLKEIDDYTEASSALYLAEDRQKAINEKAWFHYLFVLHSDNERPRAFKSVADLMNDSEYWSNLGAVWTDHDGRFIRRPEPKEFWLPLFTSDRPKRHNLMSGTERRHLASLPAKVKVFRAGMESEMSWTLSETVALKFANRISKVYAPAGVECAVLSAVVTKKRILALFEERNEEEIVLDPRGMRNIALERLIEAASEPNSMVSAV
jgi:hypothetical protein